MGRPSEMRAYNFLRTKYFHGVLSGDQHPYLLQSRYGKVSGLPRQKILHVAQSLYHDIAPTKTLGLSTVWINRRHTQPGFGATPPAQAQPDLEVPDLRTLAEQVSML